VVRRVSASGGACVGACHRRDGGSASGASGGVSCGCAIRVALTRGATVIALEILRECSCGAAWWRFGGGKSMWKWMEREVVATHSRVKSETYLYEVQLQKPRTGLQCLGILPK